MNTFLKELGISTSSFVVSSLLLPLTLRRSLKNATAKLRTNFGGQN
jgi:hypothetical protein